MRRITRILNQRSVTQPINWSPGLNTVISQTNSTHSTRRRQTIVVHVSPQPTYLHHGLLQLSRVFQSSLQQILLLLCCSCRPRFTTRFSRPFTTRTPTRLTCCCVESYTAAAATAGKYRSHNHTIILHAMYRWPNLARCLRNDRYQMGRPRFKFN